MPVLANLPNDNFSGREHRIFNHKSMNPATEAESQLSRCEEKQIK